MIELLAVAEQKANEARDLLRIGSNPVPDIVPALEHLGLAVFVQPLGTDGPLGAYLPRGDTHFVFLNSQVYVPRFRFTAAHELGHHMFGDGPRLDLNLDGADVSEKRANSFAAAFLMPREGVAARLGAGRKKIKAQDVLDLATHFAVSYQTMTYRIHNLGACNANDRDALLAQRSMVLTPDFREGNPSNQLPAEYVQLALSAYERSRVSFERLAELLGHGHDVKDLAERLRDDGLLQPDDAIELGMDTPAR